MPQILADETGRSAGPSGRPVDLAPDLGAEDAFAPGGNKGDAQHVLDELAVHFLVAHGVGVVVQALRRFTQMIDGTASKEGIAITRKDVYICNVIKCRPPENRLPEKDEIATCSPFLLRQLAVIQPKVLAT